MTVRFLFCLLLVAGACSSDDGGRAGGDAGRDAAGGRDSGQAGEDAGLDGALADAAPDAAVDAGPHVLGRGDMEGLVLNGSIPPADVPAPDFTATAHTGEVRTRADLLGTRTVMWFYPQAYTGG
jgi:hypothetical protein